MSPHDIVRNKYMKILYEKTDRNAILYYSGWLQKPSQSLNRLVAINDDDMNGFMSAVNGLDVKKGLDIILHTPGGDIAATESLIHYLDQKFDGNLRAIVPQLAMSGGTMIACACKEILMGRQSSLGPIDPQIGNRPASGIISEFKRAVEEIKADPDMIHVWNPILSKYEPTLIEICERAIAWSKAITEDYLVKNMFKDMQNNQEQASAVIEEIMTLLTDQETTKSHSRHIPAQVCTEYGLKIFKIEDEQELQDIILSIHHATISTLMNTDAIKIIENHQGQAHICRYIA